MIKKIGIFIVSVIVFSGCNLVMSMSVVEEEKAETRLRIEPESKSFLVEKNYHLKAFFTNLEGEEIDITTKASWWISDPGLAELSGSGMLHTRFPGSTRICISYEGLRLESEYNFVTPSQLWLTFYGGMGAVTTKSIIATRDKGYLILGEASFEVNFGINENCLSGYKGASDFFMLKIAANGDYQWHTFLGGSNMDIPSEVIESGDGGFIILGSSNSNQEENFGHYGGASDMLLAKLDGSGNCLWARFIGSFGEDEGFSLAELNNGDIIVAGTTDYLWDEGSYNEFAVTNVLLAQIDRQGEKILWTESFGSSKDDKPVKVQVDNRGYIYCLAEMDGAIETEAYGYNGQKDFYMRCYNSQKALEWEGYLGTQVDDIPKDMVVTNEAVVVTGSTTKNIDFALNSYSKRGKDILVAALSRDNGKMLWASFYGGSSDDIPAGIIELDEKSGFIIAGSSSASFGAPLNPYSGNQSDILLIKLNNQGALQWHSFYGGPGNQIPTGAVNASNEGIVVAGSSSEPFGDPKNAFTGDGTNLFAVHFLKNGVCPQNVEK